MLPAGSIVGTLYHSAPEDGRNYRPKHVEVIEIINKIVTFASSVVVYIIVSVMYGHTDIKSVRFIGNFNQLNMFRAIISPIFRSTRLCLQLVV